MISDVLKKKFSRDVVVLEAASQGYAERAIKEIDITDTLGKPGWHLGRGVVLATYFTFNRSQILYHSFIRSLNEEDAANGYLIARAHMETTGAIAFLYKKVRQFIDKEIDDKKIEEEIARFHLGRKIYDSQTRYVRKPSPINVLTQIDAVDSYGRKYLEVEGSPFREHYEWYSEFCHPNFFGKSIGTRVAENKIIFSSSGAFSEEIYGDLVNSMEMSCTYFLVIFNSLKKSIDESGWDLPKITP